MNFYDCCTYNNEELVLDIRLNYLNKFVKKFIIVESKFTHQGKKKDKFFNIKNFKKFENKIKYYLVDKFPDNLSNWGRENFQRNFHKNTIKDLHDDDYIMISDIDEIPNMGKIRNINNFKYTVFEQLNFSYKFNLINKTHLKWYGTRMCKKKNLKSPQWLRDQKVKKYKFFKFYKIKWNIIKKGGWHFSYLMNAKNISEKIKSFSHAEFNQDKFTNINTINEKIKNGTDLFDRNQKYQRVELDSSFPKIIFDNQKNLSEWII
jgi:beta-1,4-mannosyl-glycoprotein beta-1,4-N-acetylglucosaminyltransferase